MRPWMRVGIVHFMAFPQTMKGEGPILETLRQLCQDDYFDVVEITWIKDPEVRARARKMLQTAHMTVVYGAQPRLLSQGLNLNAMDERERRKAIDTIKEGIDEAYEMGSVGCGILSGPYKESEKEQALQALVESTRELCAYAKSKGDLKLVLEIFDFDVDKKSLVGPAALARRYAESICERCDNFGLMVDLSHIPLIRESPEEALLPVRDYLVHAHIGNCVVTPGLAAYGDQHPCFGFPGGSNDIEQLTDYLRVLLEIGYLNRENPPIVSFEVKPFGDEEPELVIANAKRTLNAAWARLAQFVETRAGA